LAGGLTGAPAVDARTVEGKTEIRYPVPKDRKLVAMLPFGNSTRREIRNKRRQGAADKAIGKIEHGMALYALTKGQWSLSDAITCALKQTGPADVAISTWTAHRDDLSRMGSLFDTTNIRSLKFLTDISFQRRRAAAAALLRSKFGDNCIRLSMVHAKFAVIRNEQWDLVIRTSMNLNNNPRFEDFTMEDSPALANFIMAIIDEIWGVFPVLRADECGSDADAKGRVVRAFKAIDLEGELEGPEGVT
jgi:hypothetical protein